MQQTASFLEKREHSRIKVKIPVNYKLIEDKKELEKVRGRHALAKDLSLNGMFMKTDKAVRLGDIFSLDISVPDKKLKHFFAFAEVVRITGSGAGVKLLLMPEEDKTALKEYLLGAGIE
jgi:c-di-GMP-binding flagellar brake protein YcgR